jgi:hypothetical protein
VGAGQRTWLDQPLLHMRYVLLFCSIPMRGQQQHAGTNHIISAAKLYVIL